MASKQSRVQAPSLQSLLTAATAGTGERPLTAGAQNFQQSFTAGRADKRAGEELDLKKRAADLQEMLATQSTVQPGEIASAQAGGLPGVPLTKGAASVQKVKLLEETRQNALEVAKPDKKFFVEASEADGVITFANRADPKETVTIHAPTADQFRKGGSKAAGRAGENKIPTFLFREELQGKTITKFIETLDSVVEKMGQNVFSSALQKGQSLVKGQAGGDATVLAFDAQRPAFGRALYKNISGDVGNIAQSEGDIGTAMLPGLLDSPALRKAKVRSIKFALKQGAQIRKQIAKFAKTNKLSDVQTQRLINDQVNTMLLGQISSLGLDLDEEGNAVNVAEDAPTKVESREDELAVELSDIQRQIAEREAELGILPEE